MTRFTRSTTTPTAVTQIAVPTSGSAPIVYTLSYGNAGGRLSGVSVIGGSGTPRSTTIGMGGGGAASSALTGITDPDGKLTGYGYGSGIHATRLQTRTNARGYTTTFSYDAGNRLSGHSVAGLVSASYDHAETRALAGSTHPQAQPLDSLYTRIDGPRTDVADVTRIWVNRHGAPTRVRDAHGAETRLSYDATWPGLVSETVTPLGLRSRAWISPTRGLVDSVTVYGPNGTRGATGEPVNATTRYLWHSTHDLVTRVTTPTGERTAYGWDTTRRNLLWLETAGLTTRRVAFGYTTAGLLSSVTPPLGGSEVYAHDSLGNVKTVTTSLGHVTTLTRDPIGRPVSVAEPDGIVSRTWYDAMDRPDSTRRMGPARSASGISLPADTLWLRNTYDANGNPTQVSRRYRKAGQLITLNSLTGYDAADRVIWQRPEDRGQRSFVLDGAGNATMLINARGDTTRQGFDALDRLVRRTRPGRVITAESCSGYGFMDDLGGSCFYSFPTVGTSYTIPADTARFDYEEDGAAGRLTRAFNHAARVTRSYTPAGLIATDSLQVRAYLTTGTGGGWGTLHRYGLGFKYDIAGRRTELEVPNQLRPSTSQVQRHTYSRGASGTGELTAVEGLMGESVSFQHDLAGRLWKTTYPNGLAEWRTFDNDGRVATLVSPGAANDAFTRDAAGRITAATLGVFGGTAHIAYSGLGAVMRAEAVAPSRPEVIELFDVDAIGNRVAERALYSRPAGNDRDQPRRLTYDGERLQRVDYDSIPVGCGSSCGVVYRAEYHHDAAGNRVAGRHEGVGIGPLHLENTHYYYGPGDELRLTNRHVGVGSGSDVGGLFEEYRYDALGRRVLTRSRSTVAGCGSAPSTPCAQSYMERTVWDGDQVLAEIRAPGGDEVASSAWESDSPSYTTLSGGTVYGRVTYTHALGALGMDAPVAVTRTGLSEGVRLVFPHANWRGEVASGSVPSSDDPCGHGAAVCPAITWPGRALTTDGAPMAGSPPPASWWGSLMERKRDGSGLQYMRNRYYDAATGKFTQVDPVGIAGGVNLYGFAEGDPVNYADPFGLMACPPMCGPSQRHIEIEAQFQEDLTPRDRAVLGGAAVVAAAGGVAVMGASTGAAVAANPVGNAVFPVVAGAVPKLMTLADKFQTRAGDIVNTAVTSGTRLLDTASGNVNAIIPRLDGASGWIRVTLDPTMSRVVSAGLQTANQVKNGLGNGRFIPK